MNHITSITVFALLLGTNLIATERSSGQLNSANQSVIATNSGSVTGSLPGDLKSETAGLALEDIEVYSYFLPDIKCSGLKNDVQVVLKNNGTSAIASIALTIGFKLNDGIPVEEDFDQTITGGWQPGDTVIFTLSDPINLNLIGENAVTVYIKQGAPDLTPENDSVVFDSFIVSESPVDNWQSDTIYATLPYQLDAGDDYLMVQWTIDNSVGRYHTCTIPGLYTATVYVTNNACHTAKSIYVLESGLGINEFTAKNLRVELYPSLANEFVNINASLLTGDEFSIELIDVSNHIVWSDKHQGTEVYTNTLDVRDFAGGIYFIRFSNAEIYQVHKIIVY